MDMAEESPNTNRDRNHMLPRNERKVLNTKQQAYLYLYRNIKQSDTCICGVPETEMEDSVE